MARRFLRRITLGMLAFFSVFHVFGQECFSPESCLDQGIVNQCSETLENGCIDWEKGIIYAVGIGIPNTKFESQAQQNRSAVVAAKVIAQRNLLEVIEGVNIDSSTTVESGIATEDRIRSRIRGKLRRSQTVGRPTWLDDGSVAVTVRFFMRSLNDLLFPRNPYNTKVAPDSSTTGAQTQAQPKDSGSTAGASGAYTGLIVDARGLRVVPALSPKLLTSAKKEVYGSAYVERDYAVRYGMMAYVKSIEQAKSNDRVAGNPLVIAAVEAIGSKGTDLVLSDEHAAQLTELYKTQSFLREARVIVILD